MERGLGFWGKEKRPVFGTWKFLVDRERRRPARGRLGFCALDGQGLFSLRKEVIQPHVPVRLPCYDFAPLMKDTLGALFGRLQVPPTRLA